MTTEEQDLAKFDQYCDIIHNAAALHGILGHADHTYESLARVGDLESVRQYQYNNTLDTLILYVHEFADGRVELTALPKT